MHDEMIPKWEAEVMVDEKLSDQRNLIVRKIKAIRRRHMGRDKITVVRLDEVLEAVEGWD